MLLQVCLDNSCNSDSAVTRTLFEREVRAHRLKGVLITRILLSGSKYLKYILFHFENRSTVGHAFESWSTHWLLRDSDTVVEYLRFHQKLLFVLSTSVLTSSLTSLQVNIDKTDFKKNNVADKQRCYVNSIWQHRDKLAK